MPTRHRYSANEIMDALRLANDDVAVAAIDLGMTVRTLQRRMAELEIRARIRYEAPANAAA